MEDNEHPPNRQPFPQLLRDQPRRAQLRGNPVRGAVQTRQFRTVPESLRHSRRTWAGLWHLL